VSEATFKAVGVNYVEADKKKWPADLATFKRIKSPNARFPVRIMVWAKHRGSLPIPWEIGESDDYQNVARRREMALFFAADPDMDVIYNICAGPMTKDLWPLQRQSMIQEAQYIQSLGLPVELSLGNEMEAFFGIIYSITTLTRSGTTATLVLPSAFPTHVGDTFTLYGMSSGSYNGVWAVASYDGHRTLTFTVPSGYASSATGYCLSITLPELYNSIRELATEIKEFYTVGPISFGCYNEVVNGVKPYDDLATNGLGGLDMVSVHPYPNTTGKPLRVNKLNSDVAPLVAALGADKVYISEFNLSSSSIGGNMLGEAGINGMWSLLEAIDDLDIQKVIIWSWDSNLAVVQADGSYHPTWNVIRNYPGRLALDGQYLGTQADKSMGVYNGTVYHHYQRKSASGSRQSVTRSAVQVRSAV
jgi:hypothetical protein